jgi:hypothetical protein
VKLLNYIVTPDFIPHSKFHRASWYHEPDRCEWYWCGLPRTKWHLDQDDDFYSTLDKPLIGVVKYLHDRGLATTPSCAGHIQDKSFYESRWDSLKSQEQRAKTSGIKLYNPETEHELSYKNPDYKLPWPRDKFVDIGMKHGKYGCLGIVAGKHKMPNVPGFIIKKDGLFVIYITKSDTADEITDKWNRFENMMRNKI